jgi:hypothetical protein
VVTGAAGRGVGFGAGVSSAAPTAVGFGVAPIVVAPGAAVLADGPPDVGFGAVVTGGGVGGRLVPSTLALQASVTITTAGSASLLNHRYDIQSSSKST